MATVHEGDTICAQATPPGDGGLHVIRVSGPRAIELVDDVFHSKSGRPLRERRAFTLGVGVLFDGARELDEVVTALYCKPRSYTGEDVVEISCHGSQVIARGILELLVSRGARLAHPGEFTKRAFLNGRLDLVQAEAVADLVQSKTKESAAAAFRQLSGGLSARLTALKADLLGLVAHVEAYVDFPEDDLEVFTNREMRGKLESLRSTVRALLAGFEKGSLYRDGVHAVIVGKPNVGKSSLLNALSARERAIVSEVPGTTRDAITEWISIGGVPVQLTDTAGVRRSADRLETLGIAKAQEVMQEASLFLWVLDRSQPLDREDFQVGELAREKPTIAVINKCDLPSTWDGTSLEHFALEACVCVSATTRLGMEALEHAVRRLLFEKSVSHDEVTIARLRHKKSLIAMDSDLARAELGFEKASSLEFIASDLRGALAALGELVGEIYTDDILDRIFSEFCIGK